MAEFAATQLMYKNSCAFSQVTSPSETPHLNRMSNMTMTVQKPTAPSSNYTSNAMASGISVSKGRMAWPSPPLAPTDVDTNYYVQDFAAACNGLAAGCSYSTAPPNDVWCASVPAVNQQPSEQYQAQGMSGNAQDPPNICTPSPSTDFGLDSTDGFLLALNCDNGDPCGHLWGVDITPSMNTFGSSPKSQPDSAVDSPASMDTPKDTATASRQEPRSVPCSASPPSDSTESGDTEKADEPYAKLIYKAIMTRPDYSMTLQEIYQWFREHTTKAVTETGGWQNSIRHNLSMNAAFRKRDKVISKAPRNVSGTTEESKRVNEWVLEDWAIRDGVQSTTRYRQKTYAKRAGGSAGRTGAEGWAVEHSVKRALSGRKGGCATRAARVGRTSSSSYGQVMQFPQQSRQLLDFRPGSPTYASSVADMYGMRPALPGQYTAMPQYPSLDAYREGMMMAACGGDVASELQQLGAADPASSDEAPAQCRRAPATDAMAFDPSQMQRHASAKYEEAEACVSALPTCRPYQPLQGSQYVWWNQTGQ
ncbi:forkhead domain-containing protein [Metarhizium album ARSEF 1941]|uniref:Forkhead domain-containing protein n=1 Tax=Metarhizium album (strain ARSEF 1941) TaxID=1081103 RepID=A0A0B2WL30_METAS|nr:forkhead domain-containing protein [Metarhizium album ARSEF 1941]KHN94658.1 forkhead domain-containing protein [Metarhizium album ARSEF 1941]